MSGSPPTANLFCRDGNGRNVPDADQGSANRLSFREACLAQSVKQVIEVGLVLETLCKRDPC
jgi:hypothetical protein